jgi:hypothetical protein
MPRRLKGYHYVGAQFPAKFYRLLREKMEREGKTMADVLLGWAAAEFGDEAGPLPERPGPGRPPKRPRGRPRKPKP